jgi:GntR family transcriptional regulator/MocR family aminotransferase
MVSVTQLYRYPIKGLSAQPLSRISLTAGKPVPHDRVYGMIRPGAPIDPDNPQWMKKGLFGMLMLDAGLARVTTDLDVESDWLTIRQDGQVVCRGHLSDKSGRADVERFLWSLLPNWPSPPALVRSRDGHFMDKPDNVISLINLATIRALERQWGYEIDPLRFRANIYIDGAEPWEEFDWVGSDIRIGNSLFTVDRRNGRCSATNVNPVTAQRDLDIPGSLRAAFGHKDLGIYLIARDDGDITVSDKLETPAKSLTHKSELRPVRFGERSFICGGCYFVYEENKGLPDQGVAAGTPFGDIPDSWRCPDCGTGKTTFKTYSARRTASGSGKDNA